MGAGARLIARVGVAALTSVAMLAAAGDAAAAGPPRAFYGVVPQAGLTEEDLERMGDGRVGTLRVALPWSDVDRTPFTDDYDWSSFDSLVAGAARQRIAVLPMAFSVPEWVSVLEGCEQRPGRLCKVTPPSSELGLEAWRQFLAAAVGRYGPEGEFWARNPGLPRRPIRAWQIWNEPNSPGFFQPHPDVGAYAELLTEAAEPIRAADPGAEVVLGGLFSYPPSGPIGGIRASEFLEQLYAQPGIEAAFDGVAVHPYGARMSGVKTRVRRVAGVVEGAGDSAEIWISEIGWASGGSSGPLNRGPRGQAKRLRQAFRWFTAKRRALDIRLVAWYAWRDAPAFEPGCSWCPRSGLFRSSDLVPKPAWESYISFTGGR